MIHIRERVSEDVAVALCGAAPNDTDDFVDAALQSDCDACRTHSSVNVGRVGDVRWDGRGKLGVQAQPEPYKPQPWPHLKTRDEERRARELDNLTRMTEEAGGPELKENESEEAFQVKFKPATVPDVGMIKPRRKKK